MEDRYEDAIPTSLVVLIIVACVIGVISVVGLIIYCVWKCGKKEEIAERIRDLEEAKEKAEFSIEFYNPNTVFIPGVEVTGSVTLTVNEPVIAKAIIISIHGKAKTHFIVTDSNGHRYYVNVDYYGVVSPVNVGVEVWTPMDCPLTTFLLILPPNSPGSFEGEMGSIRYYCKAMIYRPEGKYHLTTERMFSVIPIVDLNFISNVNLPNRITKTKKTGVLMYKDRQIEMTITMDKRGVVPGENLALDIDVANHTKKKIRNIEVTVVQMSNYVAYRVKTFDFHFGSKRRSKEEERVVVSSSERVNIEGASTEKVTRSLLIPPTVSSFNNCDIISVEYLVKINLTAEGPTTVSAELPLIIGNIPIRETPQISCV